MVKVLGAVSYTVYGIPYIVEIINLTLEGRLQAECYDEDCTQSEAMEAIEDMKMARVYWKADSNPCTFFNLCDAK